MLHFGCETEGETAAAEAVRFVEREEARLLGGLLGLVLRDPAAGAPDLQAAVLRLLDLLARGLLFVLRHAKYITPTRQRQKNGIRVNMSHISCAHTQIYQISNASGGGISKKR